MAGVAERLVHHFKAQHLANTVWAFATGVESDALPFRALAIAAQLLVEHFSGQGLANTVWAFATARQLEASVLRLRWPCDNS